MSLLQKASIITTPTAYAEDYLYSIKPAFSLGNNLVENGTFETAVTSSQWLDFSSPTTSERTSAKAYQGSFSYHIVGDTTNDGIQASATQFTGDYSIGDKVRISAFVFPVVASSNQIKTGVSNSNRSITSTYSNLTLNVWNKIEYDVQITTASNNYITFLISGSAGEFYLDNVSAQVITDADFDFDRNSTGTRVNEDYLIEDVPYNLTTYSEDFSQWTLNGDSVVLQNETYLSRPIYKLTEASSSIQGIFEDNAGNIVGQTYTISAIAKKDTSSFIRLRYGSSNNRNVDFNLETGVVSAEDSGVTGAIQNLGNGFYQISSTIASLIHSTISYAIYTTNGSVLITSAQIVKGDQLKNYLKTTDRLDIPRIDYTNGEPSILLEPQRTNLIGNNSTAPPVGSATITNNYAISPEGIQNSIRVVTTGSGNNSGVIYSVNNSSTTDTITYSAYVKGEKGKTIHIRFETTPYSLQAQELLLLDGTWQKYTKTINYTGAPTHTLKQFYLTSILSATATDFQVYGAQAEVGSYATSLIHTSGSAVTRSADAANNAGNSDLINSTEGVLYVEFKTPEPQPTAQYIAINDGAAGTNQVRIGWLNFKIYIQIRVAGSAFYTFNPSTPTHTEFNKIAVKYKASDHAVYINGQEVDTSTDSDIFLSNVLNTLSFSAYTTTGKFYGNVKSVMVFKEALTDLELAKLTGYNNHEIYMNYYNRLSYLGLVEEYNVESDINNYIL